MHKNETETLQHSKCIVTHWPHSGKRFYQAHIKPKSPLLPKCSF